MMFFALKLFPIRGEYRSWYSRQFLFLKYPIVASYQMGLYCRVYSADIFHKALSSFSRNYWISIRKSVLLLRRQEVF